MIPAGYMTKRVQLRPDWINNPEIENIYSVTNCISNGFADYFNYWKHNGFWLFDSPEIIENVAKENSIDLTGTQYFYYEVYEHQFNEQIGQWEPFAPESSFKTIIKEPKEKILEGYDVVTFSAGTSPECSPLSCNALSEDTEVNKHCLLKTFEKAKDLIETGFFNNSEPGPFRIFAVYSID